MTINSGVNVTLPIFMFGVNGELNIETDVTTSFDEAEQFTISYGLLVGGESTLSIIPVMMFRAASDGAPEVTNCLVWASGLARTRNLLD